MEKIHKTCVFMLSCTKHACFHVFYPFSAHDIIAEKGPFLVLPSQHLYLVNGGSLSEHGSERSEVADGSLVEVCAGVTEVTAHLKHSN